MSISHGLIMTTHPHWQIVETSACLIQSIYALVQYSYDAVERYTSTEKRGRQSQCRQTTFDNLTREKRKVEEKDRAGDGRREAGGVGVCVVCKR